MTPESDRSTPEQRAASVLEEIDVNLDANGRAEVELQHTPTRAVINFDGEITRVRAHTVQKRVLTRQCIGFSVHVALLAVVGITSLIMMITIRDVKNPAFFFWNSLLTFSVGAILPAPSLKKTNGGGGSALATSTSEPAARQQTE